MVVREIYSLITDLRVVFPCQRSSENRISRSLGWKKPCQGWIKLNTDGSVRKNPASSAYGGLLRSDDGTWISGFSAKSGSASITLTELLAVRDGMNHALLNGFTKVSVETDSKTVVDLLSKSISPFHPYGQTVEDCKSLLGRFQTASIVHIHREANQAADFLANLGHTLLSIFYIWDCPPVGIRNILYGDFIGTTFERLVSIE